MNHFLGYADSLTGMLYLQSTHSKVWAYSIKRLGSAVCCPSESLVYIGFVSLVKYFNPPHLGHSFLERFSNFFSNSVTRLSNLAYRPNMRVIGPKTLIQKDT